MTNTVMMALVGAALTITAVPTIASAQSQQAQAYFNPAYQAPPLTVRKRPFTDSGVVVQPGYENRYVVDQTTLHRPVYSSFTPDAYGQDVLPRPLDGLGLY